MPIYKLTSSMNKCSGGVRGGGGGGGGGGRDKSRTGFVESSLEELNKFLQVPLLKLSLIEVQRSERSVREALHMARVHPILFPVY